MASIVSAGTTNATALNMSADTSGILQLASNNGTVGMTMDTSQNVGIGTSSPTVKLQITAPVVNNAVSVAQIVTNAGTGNAGSGIGLGYGTSNGYYAQLAGVYDNTGSAFTVSTSALTVAATERMRIDSSGNMMVGYTSQIASARLSVLSTSSTNGISCQAGVNTNATFSGLNTSGSATFYVVGTGQIYSTSTSIAAISDQSQKENVVPVPYGLSEVEKLKPVKFDFKEGCASEEKGLLGFIAQEVENVIPELVQPFGEDGLLGLKMGDMLPVLVKAIQELNAKVTALENK
jgi:hypothetical protein